MNLNLVDGENEPSGEHGSIVSGVMGMETFPQTRLTSEMIRDGWRLFRAATCSLCGAIAMWNPRVPNALSCTQVSCPSLGQTPEQNQALFKERLVVTH